MVSQIHVMEPSVGMLGEKGLVGLIFLVLPSMKMDTFEGEQHEIRRETSSLTVAIRVMGVVM